MKNIFYLLLTVLFHLPLYGQNIQCGNEGHLHEDDFQIKSICTSPSHDKHKIIRINFHFPYTPYLPNFYYTTDADIINEDTSMTCYAYAEKILGLLNYSSSVNPEMRVRNAAYNAVWGSGWAKKFSFVLDGVYLNKNNTNLCLYRQTDLNILPTYLIDSNSVINIIINNRNPTGSNVDEGIAYPSLNATEMRMRTDYIDKKRAGYPMIWHYENSANLAMHEIGHILGISHTVATCSDYYGCPDGCDDTPTNGEAQLLTGRSNLLDYRGGWASRHMSYVTNNIMDYTGLLALTPCQIQKIHCTLKNSKRSLSMCDGVSRDLYLADIGYPKVSFFGKNITIGSNTDIASLENKEKNYVYFSSSLSINNFEINGIDIEFEVLSSPLCQY